MHAWAIYSWIHLALYLFLLNFIRFLLAHCFRQFKFSCKVILLSAVSISPLILVSSANFIRLLLIPASRSLTKILIALGLIVIPEGPHLCLAARLTNNYLLLPVGQFPTDHTDCVSISQGGDCGGSHLEPWRSPSRQCQLLALRQPSKLVCVEGDWDCQAQFGPGEFLLAFPNHLLCLTCNSSQEGLFQNFPEIRVRLIIQ